MASLAEERQGLRSEGWSKLDRSRREKQDRWLCWRAASQWWVAGAKLEPLGAAQVAVAQKMLASRPQQRLWEGSLGREMSPSDGCLKGCSRENEMRL